MYTFLRKTANNRQMNEMFHFEIHSRIVVALFSSFTREPASCVIKLTFPCL